MRSMRTSIGLWISWHLRRIIFISARVIGLRFYIHYVYVCSYKDICVIPLEHLDYIAGDYLTYKTFTAALQEAEESYSLKIHTGTLDEEDWESEYICIQKKDRKIK